MSQIELSYEDMKQEMIKEIQKHPHGYLATSEGEFVTVRRMGLVSDGLTIWCLTSEQTRKYKQIMANPNVAIAAGDYLQIEGVASLKGHPLDEENSVFIKAFREQLPDRYERSLRPGRILQRPDTRVIEVAPRRIALNVWTPQWDLESGFQPYTNILNLVKGEAHRISGTEGYKAPAYRK